MARFDYVGEFWKLWQAYGVLWGRAATQVERIADLVAGWERLERRNRQLQDQNNELVVTNRRLVEENTRLREDNNESRDLVEAEIADKLQVALEQAKAL